jgi:hypothetical protein
VRRATGGGGGRWVGLDGVKPSGEQKRKSSVVTAHKKEGGAQRRPCVRKKAKLDSARARGRQWRQGSRKRSNAQPVARYADSLWLPL